MSETEIEAQLVQGTRGDGFVWSEIKDRFDGFIVASDGNAVGVRETIEQRVDSLKMATLDKVHCGTSFDEKKDLRRFVYAEEIRDGLLDAVVENVEIFAAEAADELSAGAGDEDSNVDAVNADANVGRALGRLLGKSGGLKQGGASDKKGGAVSMGKEHDANSHGSPAAERTEAPFRAKFPGCRAGLAISVGRGPKV